MRKMLLGVLLAAVSAVGVVPGARLATAADPGGDEFHGLIPARVLDTRPGGATVDHVSQGAGPLAGGATLDLKVVDRGGVPADGVGAVALNVTIDAATATGYLTVWPKGVARPEASNLNFVAGQTVPNMVVVPVGADGRISIYNGGLGNAQVLVDVLGWFPTGDAFHGLTPARLLDTRPGAPTIDGQAAGGGAVGAMSTTDVLVSGRGGVPSSGVGAVALNVTITAPQRSGYVTVFPAGEPRPNASNLNFVAGRSVPNMVIVPLGADGKVSVFNGSTGTGELLVDVLGWFPAGSTFTGLTPTRLMDTRAGAPTIDGRFSGPVLLEAGVPVNLVVGGRGSVPTSGAGAVALNITVVDPTDGGYLSAYPLGSAQPNASNLNFAAGQTVANSVLVPLGRDGQIKLFLGGMPNGFEVDRLVGAHVIVDVLGWFAGTAVSDVDDPYFRPDGLGPVPLGTSYDATISSLSPLLGPITFARDESLPNVLSPGQYWNPSTGLFYAYPSYRIACGEETCLEFGGPSSASLAFVGWSSTDDRYLDKNGVGVGSRLTDFPPTGAEPDIYICGPSVRSDVAASGLALVSDLSYFGTAFSGLEAYVVQQLSIGPKLGDFNRGC